MSEYILTDKMRAWATAHGYDAELHYDYFVDYIANKEGKPYKNLDAAFRNCIRADWGGIRKQQNVPWNLAPKKQAWWASESGILEEGRRLNLDPRPGESMQNFKARIEAKQ